MNFCRSCSEHTTAHSKALTGQLLAGTHLISQAPPAPHQVTGIFPAIYIATFPTLQQDNVFCYFPGKGKKNLGMISSSSSSDAVIIMPISLIFSWGIYSQRAFKYTISCKIAR